MDGILIKDVMTKSVVSVDENDSIKTAAGTMAKNRVGSLIVKSKFGPIGIVTESDIIKKAVSRDMDLGKTKVSEIMTTPMIFAAPEQSITDAASIMITNRIRRLPVIQSNKIVGIVTHTDIVRASPAMIHLLEERLRMRETDAEIPMAEARIRVGDLAGICDNCGNCSINLATLSDEWLCEACLKKKRAANPRRVGFKDWSRMG